MGCCFSYLINLCNDETPTIYPTVHNYTVESFHITRYPSRSIYYEYNDNLL